MSQGLPSFPKHVLPKHFYAEFITEHVDLAKMTTAKIT